MISGISQLNSYTSGINSMAMKDRHDDMFNQMDTNDDGSIDKAEFTAFGQQMAEKMRKPDKSEEIFSEMDTDGDGNITKAEFDAFGEKMKSKMPSMMMAEMDANGDGSIDKAEFTAFGLQMAEESGQTDKSEEIFSEIDTDGDGSITKAELDAFDEKMKSRMMAIMLSQMDSTDETSSDNSEVSSLFECAIQQYTNTLQTDTQSILDMLG
jgi:Ca2+-binding EF-hand superfamily protein